jgi:hypothetical protein
MKDAPFCRHVPPKRSKRSAKKGSGPGPGTGIAYSRLNPGNCFPKDVCDAAYEAYIDAYQDSAAETDAKGDRTPRQVLSGSFAFSGQYLECLPKPCSRSSTGVQHIYANLSTREPTLKRQLGGILPRSWDDYHYYNRVHFTYPGSVITCPSGYKTEETISVGIAKGRIIDEIYDNEVIVEKYYRHPVRGVICEASGTGIFPDDPSALLFRIDWVEDDDIDSWLGGAWEIYVWFDGGRDLALVPTSWDVASSVTYGQELWARNNDLHNVIAPLNFAHHVVIGGAGNPTGPWHEAYLKSPLRGRSDTRADPPFSVTDLAGDDRTSISSCVPNSDNLCD